MKLYYATAHKPLFSVTAKLITNVLSRQPSLHTSLFSVHVHLHTRQPAHEPFHPSTKKVILASKTDQALPSFLFSLFFRAESLFLVRQKNISQLPLLLSPPFPSASSV